MKATSAHEKALGRVKVLEMANAMLSRKGPSLRSPFPKPRTNWFNALLN